MKMFCVQSVCIFVLLVNCTQKSIQPTNIQKDISFQRTSISLISNDRTMVRSSFAILFFIRDSRVRKDGTASIEVVLTVNGERCAFSTGKRVKSSNWDKVKQQVRGKDEEAQSLPKSY